MLLASAAKVIHTSSAEWITHYTGKRGAETARHLARVLVCAHGRRLHLPRLPRSSPAMQRQTPRSVS